MMGKLLVDRLFIKFCIQAAELAHGVRALTVQARELDQIQEHPINPDVTPQACNPNTAENGDRRSVGLADCYLSFMFN